MDNLLGFIADNAAKARGGENRWVKYSDRPNLRRALTAPPATRTTGRAPGEET